MKPKIHKPFSTFNEPSMIHKKEYVENGAYVMAYKVVIPNNKRLTRVFRDLREAVNYQQSIIRGGL